MAGNKKDSNTSKTAHVMNLISRGRTAKPLADDSTAASAEKASPTEKAVVPPPAPPVSPIISIMNADAKASSVIKDALEESLRAEIEENEAADTEAAQPAQTPVPPASTEVSSDSSSPLTESSPLTVDSTPQENQLPFEEVMPAPEEELSSPAEMSAAPESSSFVPAKEPEPVTPEPEPVAEEQPTPVEPTIPETAPIPEELFTIEEVPSLAEPSAPTSAKSDLASEESAESEIQTDSVPTEENTEQEQKSTAIPHYFNVMEDLVEKNIDKYIKMFGLCPCPQCRADVAALALTNLAPKYIVAPENELSFRMVVYENRFQAEVTAQILHACKAVMDSPRHDPAAMEH